MIRDIQKKLELLSLTLSRLETNIKSLSQDCSNGQQIADEIATYLVRTDKIDSIEKLLPPSYVAIENGRRLSEEELQKINKSQYDVILDLREHSLIAKPDPDHNTKHKPCKIKHIGPTRMKLLRYMLEHPGAPVCVETLDRIYENSVPITQNALAASIGCLRQCLQCGKKGMYIITERTFGESVSVTGSVYMANTRYKYLVIRFF